MQLTELRAFISVTSLLLLPACLGGGSGSSAPSLSMPQNVTLSLDGQTITAAYTIDVNSGKATIAGTSESAEGRASITTRDGNLIGWSAGGSDNSVTFNTLVGDTFTTQGGVILAETADRQNIGIFVDPSSHGYVHQTFGAWMTGLGTASGKVGVGSFGTRTETGNVPTGTNATYRGAMTGVATLADGQRYMTSSEVSVATDFSDLTFSSTGTQTVNVNTGAIQTTPELDFVGSGSVVDATFSANVTGSGTSGRVDGVFYGPQATEIGGTFHTSGPGGINHIGSFGGKQ